ncbi:MAG: hypothetical protein HYX99_02445 [Chloroflexi bacterium]|nr:hypothetical protein [Chloroflexota bacterium]
MSAALAWWLWAQALGLVAFPIAFILFRRLYDRGYAFSKILGLLLLAYGVWAAGTSRVLPSSRLAAWGVLAIVGAFSLAVAWSQRQALAEFLRKRYMALVVADALLLALFLVGLALRSFDPGVGHTEQPMDFAFLNALARSQSFPPEDPWLSGYAINYYYFGYLLWAAFAKLVGTPTSIAYNLALATTMGLAASGAFGIVFNLVQGHREQVRDRALGFGVLAAVLVLLAGNLEGLLELAYAHGMGGTGFWSWLGIKGLSVPYLSPTWYPSESWWWWKATRVIDTLANGQSLDYTITEFPFFSFLLGDLHPHVSALPLALLSLGLALEVLRQPGVLDWRWPGQNLGLLAVSALTIGALGFANSWDMPTYAALWLTCLGLWAYATSSSQPWWWLRAAGVGGVVLVGALLLYFPFYRGFSPQASGVWPVLGPATRPVHYFVAWGPFLLPVAYLVLSQGSLALSLGKGTRRLALALTVTPLALWSVVALGLTAFSGEPGLNEVVWRWAKLLPLALVLAVALAAAAGCGKREGGLGQGSFALLLVAFGLGTTYIAELFYVRDLFGNRMNTVFKLYYQGWLMLALGAAYGLHRWGWPPGGLQGAGWRDKLGWGGRLAWGLAVVLALGGGVYPVAAFASRQATSPAGFNLDALAPVAASRPGEYAAVGWLLERPGSPVVLEAVGDSYSRYGRVSSMTGLPTVLGWPGHEHQWRGSTLPFEGRQADVDEAYRSQDAPRVLALLHRYQVDYVYVGDLELARYGPLLDKFREMLPVAFSAPGVTIYEVPK